jgi:uncharacterized phage-associated protein
MEMFRERKIAQTAAFFADAQGGRISVLKLIKLMYLADRESLNRYGDPITHDSMYCLKDGPILSRTLDYVKGIEESSDDGWDDWITDRENKEVGIKQVVTPEKLDELSKAELQILRNVWGGFGHMTPSQIRNYTHRHCPEWKEPPSGGRVRLRYREVLKALGKTPQQIEKVGRSLRADYYIEKMLNNI